MKKTLIGIILTVTILFACKKNGGDRVAPPAQLSIAGNWNVDSVHVFFYDAAGSLDSSEIGYPIADLKYPLYFQFNGDQSWSESLAAGQDTIVVAEGTYSYTSNNTFDLIYPDANPARKVESCKIISLSNSSFIFSKQLPTVFNGTEQGYIKYVFRLSK